MGVGYLPKFNGILRLGAIQDTSVWDIIALSSNPHTKDSTNS